jgi:hypothetical protein
MGLLSRKGRVKRIKEKREVWVPPETLTINPIAPSSEDIKRIVNEFLFYNDEDYLVQIEEFDVDYQPKEKRMRLTVVGLFERYSEKTKEFELVREIRKFVIELE